MNISHETPLCLLDESRKYNDYDYCLVHLLETHPDYYQFFVDSLAQGRTVLLDNSIFELGTAFDPVKYLEWINKLKPTEYIIPDVLESALGTMDNALDWRENYWSRTPKNSKCIGVVQGKSYEDLVQCYDYLDNIIDVDKIAISFDYSYYLEVCPHPNKWMGWALGRIQTLTRMLNEGVINKDKPHHLLGCGIPIEFLFYRDSKFDWIESVDTSNPVVHALRGVGYEPGGLTRKESIKLAEMLDAPYPSVSNLHTLHHNIKYFRSYVNGNGR